MIRKKYFLIFMLLLTIYCSSVYGGEIQKSSSNWYVNKTGAEKDLTVLYEEINENSTKFCIIYDTKMVDYINKLTDSILAYNYPIKKLSKEKDIYLDKIEMNLLSDPCITVTYTPETKNEVVLKLGFDSILIYGSSSESGLSPPYKESLVIDSKGYYHTTIEDGYDLFYFNSTDGGKTWKSKKVKDNYIVMGGIVIDSNDKLYVFYTETSGDDELKMVTSTDYGGTWSGETIIMSVAGHNFYRPSCTIDGNDEIHCCSSAVSGFNVYYANSSALDTEYLVTNSGTYDVDYCDIEVDTNNNVYIVGSGNTADDLLLFTSATGWGDANKITIDSALGSVGLGYFPDIAITDDGKIYIAQIDTIDLQLYNSTITTYQTSWTQTEIDAAASYAPSIGVTDSGDIYILYGDTTTAQDSGADLYMANLSATSSSWNVRQLVHGAQESDGIIADTTFPKFNHMNGTMHYIYMGYNGNFYYNNITTTYIAPEPPSGDSCDCPVSGNWVFDKDCTITEDCDITTNRISFTTNAVITCSAQIIAGGGIYANDTTSSIVNDGACSIVK